METQKLMNQLNGSDNELSNFATKKCYAILDKNGTNYGEGINNSTTIKFETESLCDYSDTFIFVMGDITATSDNANTYVAFKNCAPFTKIITNIN